MEPQYQGNKELLKRTLTAFLASRTVQTNRVMTCYDWATSLDAETDCVVFSRLLRRMCCISF